jgi:hypothetical protein
MAFFEEPREAAGRSSVSVAIGPLGIDLEGLDEARAEALLARFGPFARAGASGKTDSLRLSLRLDRRDWFLEPPSRAEPSRLLLAFEDGRVRLCGYTFAGWFDGTRGGRGEIVLARGGYEPDSRAIENYLRAAVAWQAAGRGGALVHSASAAWRGQGFLFYGPSGAGKSTLARSNRRGTVLSDDLSLVLPDEDGGLLLFGTPFRGTFQEGPYVVGSFPLAAGFRLVQAPRAEVRTVPRAVALAELVASLPFVAEAAGKSSGLLERIEKAFAGVFLARLLFRPDDTFWDAIEGALPVPEAR